MRNVGALILLSALVFVVSCSSIKEKLPVSVDPGVSMQSPAISMPMSKLSASEIFESDEYLVADDESSHYMDFGKLMTPPSAVKAEAEFLVYRVSQKEWKDYFVKVRSATAADLNVGNEVIYYTGNRQQEVYQPPKDRSSARSNYWYKGLITDTSLLATRGIVYVAEQKVAKDNIFVAITQ